jgi:hypothetical protein
VVDSGGGPSTDAVAISSAWRAGDSTATSRKSDGILENRPAQRQPEYNESQNCSHQLKMGGSPK